MCLSEALLLLVLVLLSVLLFIRVLPSARVFLASPVLPRRQDLVQARPRCIHCISQTGQLLWLVAR